ncbi:hypothetical protein GCM10011391_22630 [Pullulanibacillus camelliae]|uniref:Na+/H+ antiporter NhaC-like C-terminal domain-containing protein n=1 Tax=Pullulanibacillus camelliae TaxID=1707096 RepID=A0A8J3DUI3_9BACL|nr:Na+/H+ antiporter NhaC family protein [Pullulanibacillus camelliae]GGE43290.1 hypothetical protein GCM10011391_22630 [Pullulanibacillus camelliae]
MDGSWIALLPFLIVIPISIFTKQVQPGLFVALLLGSYLVEPSLLGGIHKFLYYIVHNTVKSSNIRIIIFLYGFAGLINIIKMAGGIKGFVNLVSKKINTKKSAMALTWVSTIGTFSDPDFRIVTIAPIMKALKQKLKMSTRRIGMVIEMTSNPIVALVPIATGFVGYMVGLIHTSLQHAGVDRPAYTTYVKSIPFNFFSFAILAVGIYYTFFMHQKHEKKYAFNEDEKDAADKSAKTQKDSATDHGTSPSPQPQYTAAQKHLDWDDQDIQPQQATMIKTQPTPELSGKFDSPTTGGRGITGDINSNTHSDHSSIHPQAVNHNAFREEYSRHLDAAPGSFHTHKNSGETPDNNGNDKKGDIPSKPWNLIIPLAIVLFLTLFLSWWDGHFKATGFFNAFIRVDALAVMLEALLITIALTIIFFLFQRFSVGNIVTHFINGGNQLMSVVVLLALIWGVSDVSEDLGFSKYITAHVEGWIPSMLVAPVLFALGCLISYFIGSSWGTWGLLMPLGIMLGVHAHANLLLIIGAVFASGTFGAFASPLSDNTVTLCTILDLPVMKYSKSKLAPALIAAGIACLLFAGFSFIL